MRENDIVSQIGLFQYGKCDITSKPAQPKCLGNIATQSASQMWTLVRLLPLMIGHFIPRNNSIWEILLLLKDSIDIAMSPVLDQRICPFLQSVISDHHLLFKENFANVRLSPKHHFLTHYADMILRFGPLRSCWCMRFEAKHSYFKQLSLRVGNYKNLCKTLAERHQNLQAYINSTDGRYSSQNINVTAFRSE